jgi:hypothetical protein
MPALVAGTHLFADQAQTWMAPSSGLPELGIHKVRRKSGKPDLQ